MGLSVFNTALNKVSKVSSFAGTGSQVIRGLKNPNLAQGVSGVLTALAGRSKLAKKLLTIDSKFKDILTKIGGIGDLFRDPKAPIEVWSDSPYSIGKHLANELYFAVALLVFESRTAGTQRITTDILTCIRVWLKAV